MMEEELKMTCIIAYPFPYFLLLIFNALSFFVNGFYDNLNNGIWSPLSFSYESEFFRQRPYQMLVYVINSLATVIFLVYMAMPKHRRDNQTETQMVVRWFIHIIGFIFILLIWILTASQLWIYKICLYYSKLSARYATNDNWKDPIYTILYSVTIIYGLFVVFPCIIYLLWYYFVQAEKNYKANPQNVYFHKLFNKICYFATYISIITVMGLNLRYLDDYEYYFMTTLYPSQSYAFLQVQMSLPITYLEYVFSGMVILFAAFLLVKEIFDTMKSKKKHIRRQLLVFTSAILCLGVLTFNKIIEVTRMNEVIKSNLVDLGPPFYQLYDHTRTIMWCYVFLIFPLSIYSTRNYWREWKNQFASGEHTETHISENPIMGDNIDENAAEVQKQEGQNLKVESQTRKSVKIQSQQEKLPKKETNQSHRKKKEQKQKVSIRKQGVQVEGSSNRFKQPLLLEEERE